MTALVAPDAVEAAARAMYSLANFTAPSLTWETAAPHWRDVYREEATAALAAAAPLIAKQTLEEAYFNGHLTAAALTACAATLTPKEN